MNDINNLDRIHYYFWAKWDNYNKEEKFLQHMWLSHFENTQWCTISSKFHLIKIAKDLGDGN